MKKRGWLAFSLILVAALSVRLCIVHYLSNDAPDDGRLYAQLARNILEQHIYAIQAAPPYTSTLIRLPGYPLFLASIYALFGHGNDAAVRFAQALIDTATCALICLLAYLCEPEEKRRRRTALIAFLLAAFCPWTSIYVGTILTETWALFLTTVTLVAASIAWRHGRPWWKVPHDKIKWLRWWIITGLISGAGTMFRPDGGLLAVSIGLVIILNWLFSFRDSRHGNATAKLLTPFLISAFAFAVSFALVLLPWTWRNAQLFHVFQPVAPAYTNMPDEFVPRGYYTWARTWIDDNRYVDPFLWSLDSQPIKVEDFPPSAFASDEERARVAALLERYNHPPPDEDAQETEPAPAPEQNAKPEKQASDEENDADKNSDEQDEDDDSANEEQPPTPENPEPVHVEMTPEIDAGFAQIARERIAHAPLRYYVWLPLKRAAALWFDTHAQYWPFDGELFPLSALDEDLHQQYWLPFFGLLNISATLLAVGGALRLWFYWWKQHHTEARLWLWLSVVVIAARLAFLSSLENIEPRYTVELFPLVIVLSSLAITGLSRKIKAGDVRGSDDNNVRP